MTEIGKNTRYFPNIGTTSDIVTRLRNALAPWFPPAASSPVLQSVLTGAGDQFNFLYQLLQFASSQTRISTATGGWLDMIAWDYLGPRFQRRPGEPDNQFSARILKEIVRPRQTRAAIAQMLTDLIGSAPQLWEPWNPGDNGGYALGVMGYNYAGFYGSLMYPNQIFITTLQPRNVGIPNVGGYSSSIGGYNSIAALPYLGGAIDYSTLSQVQGAVTDADIYADVSQTIAAGTTGWVDITGAYPVLPLAPGMYPPWTFDSETDARQKAIKISWIPPDPDPWFGNKQELEARKMASSVLAVPVSNPPPISGSMNGSQELWSITSTGWIPPDPTQWFRQPYDYRKNAPPNIAVPANSPNPRQRDFAALMGDILVSWMPPDPFQYDRQPSTGHIVWGELFGVPANPPPPNDAFIAETAGAISTAWIPPDPTWMGAGSPYVPMNLRAVLPLVNSNAPASNLDIHITLMQIIAASWVPPDPTPFMQQPYAPRRISAALLAVPVGQILRSPDEIPGTQSQIANQSRVQQGTVYPR